MKLLLVEDEPDLAAAIAAGLKKRGYAVDTALDGEEALQYYRMYEYDLMILDLNLPKMDGLAVLNQIRKTDAEMKIIIVSARTAIEQRVEGLDAGANDYLVKPFAFLELEARIRTLLRMEYTQQSTCMTCGQLTIDIAAKRAFVTEHEIPLTKKEYSILEYLFFHKDKVLSSEKIIEHVWDSDAELYLNSLKYHIHSLKKKLAPFAHADTYITNSRGHGYMISEDTYHETVSKTIS